MTTMQGPTSASQQANKAEFQSKMKCRDTCADGSNNNNKLEKCWDICNLSPKECRKTCKTEFGTKKSRKPCKKGCKEL